MLTFDEVWQRYEEATTAMNARAPHSSEEEAKQTDDERDRMRELRYKRERAKQRVLGHPESFGRVRCWMVDAVGRSADCQVSKKLLNEMVEGSTSPDRDVRHAYTDKFGGLNAEVKKVMSKYHLTDSGGGGGGWHLGCHCTEFEAQTLCRELHVRFAKAIEAGRLEIQRKDWSLSLAQK